MPAISTNLAPVVARMALLAMLALGGLARGGSAPQALQRLAGDFVSPVVLIPLDPQRLLVVDQIGLIHVMDRAGARRADPFLDLRAKLVRLNQGFDERGLLGLALHPEFRENRKIYLYYSAPRRPSRTPPWDHTSRLSEFTATPGFERLDPASERVLLEIDQPYFNHNGGRLAFGPDRFLYLGVGDGGNANDRGHDRAPAGNGQDLTTLLGKILRLDIHRAEDGRPYAIPGDNPLIGMPGARPEIFAWGLRNPWGIAFDRGGEHELFAADVGQARYEEINVIRKGGNYGWNLREGRHAFDPDKPMEVRESLAMQPSDRNELVDPIIEYKNLNAFPTDPQAQGVSVTGGSIYRGRALPHLAGRYVFADWSRQWAAADGRLFVGTRPAQGTGNWTIEPLPLSSHPDLKLGMYVLALGEDDSGELYVLTSQRAGLVDRTGAVWKLIPSEAASR
jgi:glucose/arabinose dehydrogenase